VLSPEAMRKTRSPEKLLGEISHFSKTVWLGLMRGLRLGSAAGRHVYKTPVTRSSPTGNTGIWVPDWLHCKECRGHLARGALVPGRTLIQQPPVVNRTRRQPGEWSPAAAWWSRKCGVGTIGTGSAAIPSVIKNGAGPW
jgi:hypothetical protein